MPRQKRRSLVTGATILLLIISPISSSKREVELHSTHAGSMGGILALKKNECHAAPMHLLAENGDYNIPYLKNTSRAEIILLLCC